MKFQDLGISSELIRILEAKALVPMPIQHQAVPVLMTGKSAMLVAQTGSGKTLAYLLPLLSRINTTASGVQAVVLAPTHELAMQIYRVATELIREAGMDVRAQALIGGAASSRQIEGLKKKPHLVIGSAGRFVHLMDLGKLRLRDATWLVFDEADRLLMEENMEHIRRITGDVGPSTHYVFVSATEGPASTRFAKSLAPELEIIRVQEERISPAIRHLYLICEERDKIEWLRKVLRGIDPARALVFVHRGASAERMAERLDFHHLAVADLHGARDKFDRQAALDSFRKGQAKVLIASDIAARGLDIVGVELVVNVDVPTQSRDYLHRAGRTGRAGARGMVLSLMTEAESRLAKRYATELNVTMEAVRMARGTLTPVEDGRVQILQPDARPAGPGVRRGVRANTRGQRALNTPGESAMKGEGSSTNQDEHAARPKSPVQSADRPAPKAKDGARRSPSTASRRDAAKGQASSSPKATAKESRGKSSRKKGTS